MLMFLLMVWCGAMLLIAMDKIIIRSFSTIKLNFFEFLRYKRALRRALVDSNAFAKQNMEPLMFINSTSDDIHYSDGVYFALSTQTTAMNSFEYEQTIIIDFATKLDVSRRFIYQAKNPIVSGDTDEMLGIASVRYGLNIAFSVVGDSVMYITPNETRIFKLNAKKTKLRFYKKIVGSCVAWASTRDSFYVIINKGSDNTELVQYTPSTNSITHTKVGAFSSCYGDWFDVDVYFEKTPVWADSDGVFKNNELIFRGKNSGILYSLNMNDNAPTIKRKYNTDFVTISYTKLLMINDNAMAFSPAAYGGSCPQLYLIGDEPHPIDIGGDVIWESYDRVLPHSPMCALNGVVKKVRTTNGVRVSTDGIIWSELEVPSVLTSRNPNVKLILTEGDWLIYRVQISVDTAYHNIYNTITKEFKQCGEFGKVFSAKGSSSDYMFRYDSNSVALVTINDLIRHCDKTL